jgi:hypothetical protein
MQKLQQMMSKQLQRYSRGSSQQECRRIWAMGVQHAAGPQQRQ